MNGVRTIAALLCAVVWIAAAPASTLYASTVNSDGLVVVQAYDAGAPSNGPIHTLAGLTSYVTGIDVDASGNVYVSQSDPNQPVAIFKAGQTRPSLILDNPYENRYQNTNPMARGADVAVGKDGTVYALMACGFSGNCQGARNTGILVYKAGSKVPSTYLRYDYVYGTAKISAPLCYFTGLTVDGKGNLYATCNGVPIGNGNDLQVGRVIEFPAGQTAGVDTGIRVAAQWPATCTYNGPDPGFYGAANDVQIDADGNFVVLGSFGGGGYGKTLFVYKRGVPRPLQAIVLGGLGRAACQDTRTRIRFDATRTHLFVNYVTSSNPAGSVDEYAYPSGKLVATFTGKQFGASALAVSPGAIPQ